MIPCAIQLVVVDRVEEDIVVVEVGSVLVPVELAPGAVAAGDVGEGTAWRLCLLPSGSPIGLPPTNVSIAGPALTPVAYAAPPRATPR